MASSTLRERPIGQVATTVSGLAPVSHTYAAPGMYIVCLTITDSLGGCTSTFCDSLIVSGGGGGSWCNANFTHTVSTCDVNFTSTSTASSAIVAYYWYFGDGGTSFLANPSHTYSGAGPWTVDLTIVTADSCSHTYSTSVSTPGCGGGSGCSASYWWVHDSTGAYTILLFPTYSGSPATTTYLWTFGDGSSSTSAYPSHVYAGVGTYVVCVTISDAALGCSATYCDSIAVTYKTAVPFSINVVDLATDVKKPVLGNDLSVFPNPFGNELNISLSLNEGRNVSVELVDIAGRVVSSSNAGLLSAGSQSLSLNTAGVAPGIYLVRVKAGDQTFTRKVVAH